MEKQKSLRILYRCFSILYVFPLLFFYMKYVPLVKGFQMVLLLFLLLVLVTAALSLSRGIVLFVFLLPLINGLPYFFGISEHTPHAPTALVLFLFFLWGWLINRATRGTQESVKTPIHRPLFFFAAAVVVSGIFAFLKFSNFFPFLSDSIYELQTNVIGVSAGGALMSVLFSCLNYLTGFLFFLIVLSALKSEGLLRKILLALCSAMGLALLFGLFQYSVDRGLGNTDFWVQMEQINATFKDPNSFGLFLAVICPLALAVALTTKGIQRILAFALAGLILFIFPQVGMRSGFLAIVVSLLLYFALAAASSRERLLTLFRKRKAWVGVGLIVIVLAAAGYWGFRDTRLFEKIHDYSKPVGAVKDWIRLSPERYFLWNEAVEMIEDTPVSGVGIGSYIIELPNYYTLNPKKEDDVLAEYRRIDSAENYLLHVGAEMGLVGVLFALWLFTGIMIRMIKATRSGKDWHSQILIFGLLAGMVAYFVNLAFHSFIGSFEVKYLFWLGVAVLFGLDGKEESIVKRGRSQKVTSIIGAGLLVFFGGTSLWQACHSFSLKSRTERFGIQQTFGFYGPEETEDGRSFQWSGKNAGLTLTVDKPIIQVPLHASHPDLSEKPLAVRVYLVKDLFKEKRLLEEISISKNTWQTRQFDLSEEAGQERMLLFEVSRTWSPVKALGIPDARRLGVAVGRIEYREK